MPVCPNCETEHARRVDKMCPTCYEDIILYEGQWYLASEGSPTQVILSLFEELVSEKLSNSSYGNVVWDVRKGSAKHKRELGHARKILEECGGDLEYAKEVLQEAFHGKDFAWKRRQSLTSVLGDLSFLQAIIKARHKAKEEQISKEQEAFKQAMSREDIFND